MNAIGSRGVSAGSTGADAVALASAVLVGADAVDAAGEGFVPLQGLAGARAGFAVGADPADVEGG